MKLTIIIIILLIIVIYLHKKTLVETKKKEKYGNSSSIQCTRNCGVYNIDKTTTSVTDCLSCGYCGVCTLPNKSQVCMSGDEDGSYYNEYCSGTNWTFGSGLITPSGDDYSYESQLTNLGQKTNLPSQASTVSYEIEKTKTQKTNNDKTTLYLSNLLNKLNQNQTNINTNDTNAANTIDKDTILKLQQILAKLKSSQS
jgi:hypothetical protein